MKKKVLIITAHHDDAIIGAGGTIAKYSKKGITVTIVVFSHDIMPHIKKEIVHKKTLRESKKVNEIVGVNQVIFLGQNPKTELVKIITEQKPEKIITHDEDDADPAHRKVNVIIKELATRQKIKCPIYSFAIWGFGKLRKRELPRLIVDISTTFYSKINALQAHKSKRFTLNILIWKLVFQGKVLGLLFGYKYAEIFYRIAN